MSRSVLARALRASRSQTNSVRFDKQKLSIHFASLGMLMQESEQYLGDWRHGFGSVSHLKCDDAAMIYRRVGCDIGEITVERYEDGI